jgi:hypothetical protein
LLKKTLVFLDSSLALSNNITAMDDNLLLEAQMALLPVTELQVPVPISAKNTEHPIKHPTTVMM